MIMLKKLAWIFSGSLKSVKIQQLDKTSFDVYLFKKKKMSDCVSYSCRLLFMQFKRVVKDFRLISCVSWYDSVLQII